MTDRYDLVTARDGSDGKTYWTRIGTMWPAKGGAEGFAMIFDALPAPNKDGVIRVIARPPKEFNAETEPNRPYKPKKDPIWRSNI